MLLHFVRLQNLMYELKEMSRNIHSLIHSADDVRNHGPLDTFGAFSFELYLFKIKSVIKGNKHSVEIGAAP